MRFIDLAAQQELLRPAIEDAIGRVLDHGAYVMGPEVAELEAALAESCGAPEVISCGSGTDALLLVLMARGVGPGDAVFLPSFTFAATAEVVAVLGATPVFVDIEPDGYGLDPQRLADAVAGLDPALHQVGVIAVDLFGLPADYTEINRVAVASGLWVVADAAQSFGATRDGVNVGLHAPATTTSFFPAKPLGCYGDGGAVFCTDADEAAVIRSLRVHGQGSDKYDNVRVGINGRLDTIQAAVLLQKLTVFGEELMARQAVADQYDEVLRDAVVTPSLPAGATSSWAQYTIRVPQRDAVAAALREAEVPTAVYYPRPLHLQTAYLDQPRGAGGLPVSEQLAGEVLSLPMHPYLTPEEQERVTDALLAALPSDVAVSS